MATPTTKAILEALESASYYKILDLPQDAPILAVQDAFHRFALEYHPDRHVHASQEERALLHEVFKRGTEAFVILGDVERRPLYDEGLARGHVRFLEGEAAQAALDAIPKEKTLEDIATTPKAKELARKADRLIVAKKFEEARVLLTDAVQDDFENEELKAKLYALYTVEGYEQL
jgi:curved DNA-binding protein CbpA